MAFSPLAQGLLLDKFDPANPPQFEPGDHRKGSKKFETAELLKLKPKLQKLKQRFGQTTEDLAAMYAAWRGRAPKVDAMLKDRGLSDRAP